MAYEGAQLTLGTLSAAGDLSTKQYHFVKLASATTVNVCTAITDVPIGVLQNKPESGETAEICIFGITKVVADGTVAFSRWIGTSTDSQAAGITPGSDDTVYVMGQAITAGAAGTVMTVLLNPTNCRAK